MGSSQRVVLAIENSNKFTYQLLLGKQLSELGPESLHHVHLCDLWLGLRSSFSQFQTHDGC